MPLSDVAKYIVHSYLHIPTFLLSYFHYRLERYNCDYSQSYMGIFVRLHKGDQTWAD